MNEKPTSHQGLSRIDLGRIRQRLLEMRDEFEARGGERDLIFVKRVDSALRKMSHGGYGFCESCARPVIKDRLLETPHVRYCSLCSESGGARTPAPARSKTFA